MNGEITMGEKEIWKAIDDLREFDLEISGCLNRMKGKLDIIGYMAGITLMMIIGIVISMLLRLA